MTSRRTRATSARRAAEDTLQAPAEPAYAIDFNALEGSGRSAEFIVRSRLCWQCQQLLEEMDEPESSVRDHMKRIADDCSQRADYLLPGTPLTEAVFRLLLAGGNRPMTIREIQDRLTGAWASVIYMKDLSEELLTRLLETQNEYMIRRVE